MSEFIPVREKKDDGVAIRVENITKRFKVYLDKGVYLKERVLFKNRNRYEERNVLRGISFEVKKGEAIGLIGENGCGKSTTLKLLSRIMYPDSGKIEINGRVSALIELGAGFHPDMSGRENIYTNAAIFGLSKGEIDRRLQTIIDFSELGDYIDNPVRTYSSGMYMRLAFSVAINVDADVLLIDEILAVGDMAFQAKCFNKLREIKNRGTTIVIVSHSLAQIEQICERSYWISEGKIREQGAPRDVHPLYMDYMSHKGQGIDGGAKTDVSAETLAPASAEAMEQPAPETPVEPVQPEAKKRWGSGEATMQSVQVLDRDGNERTNFAPNEPITVRIAYTAQRMLPDSVVGIAIYKSDQTFMYGTNSLIDTSQPVKLQRQGTIDLVIDSLPVANGCYTIDLALHRPDGFNFDFWREICTINIAGKVNPPGLIYLPHLWEFH